VLSRLFRRLVLEGLTAAFDAGQLHFFTALSSLNDRAAFAAALAPLRRTDWVVYAKRTFAGPKRVLAYLARYTHRVAMTNNRLLEMNGNHVSFSCKDSGGTRKVMTLKAGEFIRRFLLHVLPDGFHRIRNYGLLANGHRAEKLAVCRRLLEVPSTTLDRSSDDDKDPDATDAILQRGDPQMDVLAPTLHHPSMEIQWRGWSPASIPLRRMMKSWR